LVRLADLDSQQASDTRFWHPYTLVELAQIAALDARDQDQQIRDLEARIPEAYRSSYLPAAACFLWQQQYAQQLTPASRFLLRGKINNYLSNQVIKEDLAPVCDPRGSLPEE
jgi:hypothetical protein